MIHLYPRTTLEPSIFGFFTTGAAIVFSGTVGSFVDRFPRLRFVRATIVVQKATVGAAYVLFLISFIEIGPQEGERKRLLDGFFAIITILSALLNLATVSSSRVIASTVGSSTSALYPQIGISVAVERDWVTCIAQGDSALLTKLNTFVPYCLLLPAQQRRSHEVSRSAQLLASDRLALEAGRPAVRFSLDDRCELHVRSGVSPGICPRVSLLRVHLWVFS